MADSTKLDEILRSDPFYSPDTLLDLSGFPSHLQKQPGDAAEDFDKNGFPVLGRQDGELKGLREFVQNPDSEAVERIAGETSDPELLERVEDGRAEQAAKEFKAAHPDYYATQHNNEALADYLEEFGLEITAQNFAKAFRALSRAGQLEARPGSYRRLTEAEKLHCGQLAATGRVDEAISEYVTTALGDEADTIAESTSAEAFLSDPAYRPLVIEATLFAWQNSRHDFSPTRERLAFLKDYCGNRFVTVGLLDAAWKACQRAEQDARLDTTFAAPDAVAEAEPTPQSLDDLEDGELEKLYHRSAGEIARQR